MLDANAAGVDLNEYYFVEVFGVTASLSSMGLKPGMVALCQNYMRRGDDTYFKLWLVYGGDPILCNTDDDIYEGTWFVYAGDVYGDGYISNKSESMALEFLGGCWKTKLHPDLD